MYVNEVKYEKKEFSTSELLIFLFFSFLLSIGVGMASGGTQHFIDTPAYSSYLIPLGLALGCIAFVCKNQVKLTARQWALIFCSNIIMVVVLYFLLIYANSIIPNSLRVGHGSHGHDSKVDVGGHHH
jgi:drug/metabolite transporter (DMT)-like permease